METESLSNSFASELYTIRHGQDTNAQEVQEIHVAQLLPSWLFIEILPQLISIVY